MSIAAAGTARSIGSLNTWQRFSSVKALRITGQQPVPNGGSIMNHQIASEDKWISARKQLLLKEKEFTQMQDEVNRLRRGLPWVRVEKNYVFDTPDGKQSLAQLFDGRSQLVVY